MYDMIHEVGSLAFYVLRAKERNYLFLNVCRQFYLLGGLHLETGPDLLVKIKIISRPSEMKKRHFGNQQDQVRLK